MSFYPSKAFLILCFAAWQAEAQLPAFTSVKTTGGNRPNSGNAIATDSSENIYLAGAFGFQALGGAIDLGTTNLVSRGGSDGFIAKFNADGICQWARQIGGADKDDAYDVVVCGDGVVLVTGEFLGTTTIGSTNLVSNGGFDIFLAAFSAGGDLLWARNIGGTLDDFSIALAAGATNVFFAGSFSGAMQLGTNSFSSVDDDALLIKLDANGTVQWARSAGGPGFQLGSDIKVDGDGNTFLAGEFENAISLGTTNLTSTGRNVFLGKYDSSGNLQWARKLGEGSAAELPRIALGSYGRLLCAAAYFGPYSVASQALPDGLDDVLLASFSSTGEKQWVTTFGGPELDVCTDLLLDAAGSAYLVGHFRGTISIANTNISSSGSSDILVAKCDKGGQMQWARKAGGLGPDVGLSGVLTGPAELLLTGSFSGAANFGGIPVTSSDGLPKAFLATITLAPQLRITGYPGYVVLGWSTNLPDFTLESTFSLSSPSWFEVTIPRNIVNSEFVVTNQPSQAVQFFRLSD